MRSPVPLTATESAATVTEPAATPPARSYGYTAKGDTAWESRPGGVAISATYNGFGQLESYDRSNTGLQVYTYNGLDDRVKVVKPTATRHFVYDADGRVMAEYGLDASDVKAEFIWMNPSLAGSSPFGGGDHIGGYAPLAVATPDTFGAPELRWVHGNHLGVPLVTTNASGSPIAPQNDYMLPGFPGQSMALTDLYYNRHRDYDPVTGRYIQADPLGLGGGSNLYLYAGANPVNYVDPEGLNPGLVRPAVAVGELTGQALILLCRRYPKQCMATIGGAAIATAQMINNSKSSIAGLLSPPKPANDNLRGEVCPLVRELPERLCIPGNRSCIYKCSSGPLRIEQISRTFNCRDYILPHEGQLYKPR